LTLDLEAKSPEEIAVLQRLIDRLKSIKEDPKLEVVIQYLDKEQWLSLGVIIFSQYYDTVKWMSDSLAAHCSSEVVGLYAGAGKSRLYQSGNSVNIEREALKRMVIRN